MKRKAVACAIFLLFLVLLSGCKEHPDDIKKNQKEELLLWSYYETEAQKEGLDKLVDGFNK